LGCVWGLAHKHARRFACHLKWRSTASHDMCEAAESRIAKMTTLHDDIANMPFEKAMGELEQIVQRLEAGKVDLEESIAIYERGEALKKRCETLLKQAEARIEKMTISPQGQVTGVEPLDEDA
jgi:exodeoxyribonuclease VII small subunit